MDEFTFWNGWRMISSNPEWISVGAAVRWSVLLAPIVGLAWAWGTSDEKKYGQRTQCFIQNETAVDMFGVSSGHSEVLVKFTKLRTRLGCLSSGGRNLDPRHLRRVTHTSVFSAAFLPVLISPTHLIVYAKSRTFNMFHKSSGITECKAHLNFRVPCRCTLNCPLPLLRVIELRIWQLSLPLVSNVELRAVLKELFAVRQSEELGKGRDAMAYLVGHRIKVVKSGHQTKHAWLGSKHSVFLHILMKHIFVKNCHIIYVWIHLVSFNYNYIPSSNLSLSHGE